MVSVVFLSLSDTLKIFEDDLGHFLKSLFFHDFLGFRYHILTSHSNNNFKKNVYTDISCAKFKTANQLNYTSNDLTVVSKQLPKT